MSLAPGGHKPNEDWSAPLSVPARRPTWASVVANWACAEDARSWAASYGVPLEQLSRQSWITFTAKLPPQEGGIGKSMAGLVPAILADPRFAGSWVKFQAFLEGREARKTPTTEEWTAIVESWTTREAVLQWATASNLSLEQLGSRKFLQRTAKLPISQGGLDQNLWGLGTAISKRFGDWERFRSFLGMARSWAPIVDAWNTADDAYRWAAAHGIPQEKFSNQEWLCKVAKLQTGDGGIGNPLTKLVRAILADPRFKDGWTAFQAFLEGRESTYLKPCQWNQLVDSWTSREHALKWAAERGMTSKQLVTLTFLRETARLPAEQGGIGASLSGLAAAIPRRFGTFDNFKRFLGMELAWALVVGNWVTAEDAVKWAESKGFTREQLGNKNWLERLSKKSLTEGGIGAPMAGLTFAVLKDPRFVDDWQKFRRFLGFEPVPNKIRRQWDGIVSEWHTKEAAAEWATRAGISLQQLGSAGWLLRGSGRPKEEGGVGELLGPLRRAILKTPRFANDWQSFRRFLGLEERTPRGTWTSLVRGWKESRDAIIWAEQNGITVEQLANKSWLLKVAKQTHDGGGIGRSLVGLAKAIEKHPLFNNSWRRFQGFLGAKPKSSWDEVVNGWRTLEDARHSASEIGISLEQLGTSSWLVGIAKRPPELGGIGQNLHSLYAAIHRDSRFEDWQDFQIFLGMKDQRKVLCNWDEIVARWETRDAALEWAAAREISTKQLGSASWLCADAKLPLSEGGTNEGLSALYRAIRRNPRFKNDWQSFRSFLGLASYSPTAQAKSLRQLLDSDVGQALSALASNLDHAAAAEYLVAKYQDRFTYDHRLLANLRTYLGDVESTGISSFEKLPLEIFTIGQLRHLRHALFCRYRDAYQPIFAKGLQNVTDSLSTLRAGVASEEHRHFVDSLILYFAEVDKLPHPKRLKRSLEEKGTFPASHQKIAMYEALNSRTLLLADEMGSGKTGSAIGTFEHLFSAGIAKKCLIVVPAKVVPVWRTALSEGRLGYFATGHTPKVAIIGPGLKDWRAAVDAEYVVVSLEVLRRGTLNTPNLERLKRLGADCLIVDEVHNAKKVTGVDTENVFALSQSESVRKGHLLTLSGTPVPNTIEDIAAQIRLLYAGREEISNLALDNVRMLSRQIVRSHPLLVRNLLVRKMMRRETKNCLEVGCAYHEEVLSEPLSALDMIRYESILKNPFMSAFDKILHLRKACLQSESKYEQVKRALEHAFAREKYHGKSSPPKVIVAESWFACGVTRDSHDLRPAELPGKETYMASRLVNDFRGRAKVFVLDGRNSTEKESILQEFGTCERPAILVTLMSVMGEGLNLICAADGIILSPPDTNSRKIQFIRRMLRPGQTLPVDVQVLLIRESLEDGILKYSDRKAQVVRGFLDGRPLTAYEKDILRSDETKIRNCGVIAYEAFTPRQKALWILSRLRGKGREAIEAFLYADNGRYAKDFASGYPTDEETSYSGNTARLVTSVIDTLPRLKTRAVADIACGCRTLQRMYEGAEHSISVVSVDLNRVALEAGALLMKKPITTVASEVTSMSAVPFKSDSIDTAVISLALEYTCHNHSKPRIGTERINAILEVNRILKKGGHAILTFQDRLFPNVETFSRFAKELERCFGFKAVSHLTGLTTAYNREANVGYKAWLLTIEKVAPAAIDLTDDALWTNLRFPKKSHTSDDVRITRRNEDPAKEKTGAFQEKFQISGLMEVAYKPNTLLQIELAAKRKDEDWKVKQLHRKVQLLIARYAGIENIPGHLLLSLTPDDVTPEVQAERDAYFLGLLMHHGSVEKIPIGSITPYSSIIGFRGNLKRKGLYLCLARLNDKKVGGFGTRYFQTPEQ